MTKIFAQFCLLKEIEIASAKNMDPDFFAEQKNMDGGFFCGGKKHGW